MHKIFDQSERALCLSYVINSCILHVYNIYIFWGIVMRFTSECSSSEKLQKNHSIVK